MGIIERAERRLPVESDAWPLSVVVANPGAEFAAVLELRRRVFGVEQGMVDAAVNDRDDGRSLNALALQVGPFGPIPVGTGRLTPGYNERGEALIAWVATLPEARQRGVGSAVMRFLLDAADAAGVPRVVLAAQTHAEGFYRRLGFLPAGEPYLVRGVPHRWMARLSAPRSRTGDPRRRRDLDE